MPNLIELFMSIGLSEQKAKETVKNDAVTKTLNVAINEASKTGNVSLENGILLYHMATKMKLQIRHHVPLLVSYITSNKIDSTLRIDAAIEYLLLHVKDDLDILALDAACGVGVVVKPEQIEEAVERVIIKYKKDLLEKRYHVNTGPIMQEVRNELKWADGKTVKNEVDLHILDLLGPKTEIDLMPLVKHDKKSARNGGKEKIAKSSKPKPVNQNDSDINNSLGPNTTIFEMMSKVNFHNPGDNQKTDGYVVTSNTSKLLEAHLKVTGGKVRTRFPPEPNGILHIGHAKAININFGYAASRNGICFLRYDDTNPEKEEEKFFLGIKDMVQWLGYKPFKVTHSSDYFDQLYKWALVLIVKGLSYVCHQKQEEMKGFNLPPSPWRDRPIEENLLLFRDMKNGLIDEGGATLRLKVTLEEGKQDPVAYRIKFWPHHRTSDKWCIYPTYDYTHCLCDSIENITHSLCTKEFQSRRSSYYWLCNALDIYCPVQWEYGRLNMNYTVVSKRKIARLITEGLVKDWDDPRLFTLSALRRRGFPSEAINRFCALMGVTGAQSVVDPMMLEACVRDILNEKAPRVMVVLNPLKVTIVGQQKSQFTIPDFPNEPERGCHVISFNKVIYIEQSDFKQNTEKGYRRLSPEQSVGLRYAGLVLTLVNAVTDSSGRVVELVVTAESATVANKPKAFIHWVAEPINLEVRIYESLFQHKNPEDSSEVPNGFLSDVNPNSLSILMAYGDASLQTVRPFQNFQFERIGFFTVDPDSTSTKLVFNQTVSLKEDSGKKVGNL